MDSKNDSTEYIIEEITSMVSNTIVHIQPGGGSHIKFSKKIYDTILNAQSRGYYSMQFFMGNQYSYKRSQIGDKDLQKCISHLQEYPLNVYTHFPYVANLAGSKDILAWEDNKKMNSQITELLRGLEYELNTLAQLQTTCGVVIHPGNYPDRKKGLTAIAKSINRIKFRTGAQLLLENSAGQGTSLCTTLEEYKEIYDQLNENQKEYVGLCIDTCHLFAYGDYNFGKIEDIDRFFIDLDSKVGLDHLKLIHLNDSKMKQGSKKDRHALLGTGCIWGENYNSLRYFMNILDEGNIPFVLETGPMDMYTLTQIYEDNQKN